MEDLSDHRTRRTVAQLRARQLADAGRWLALGPRRDRRLPLLAGASAASGAEQAETEYSRCRRGADGQQARAMLRRAPLPCARRNPSSPYADQADLALARAAVDRRDYDEAAKRLRGRDGRLARHGAAPGRAYAARARADRAGEARRGARVARPSTAGAFAPHFHDVRGDASPRRADTAGARREYDAALAADPSRRASTSAYVTLKRDSLPPRIREPRRQEPQP